MVGSPLGMNLVFNALVSALTIFLNKIKPSDHNSRNKIYFTKLVTNNQNIKVTRQVDLFAVEVEASGYLSQSLNYLLIRFGCPNKLWNSTVKNLGRVPIEFSFQIWLQRQYKVWTSPNVISYNISHSTSKESSFYPNGTTKTFCI